MKILSGVQCGFVIRCAVGSTVYIRCYPLVGEVDLVVVDLLLNSFAHGLPQCSNLVVARSGLNRYKLFGVEPAWSVAVEHVVLYCFPVCVDEFRDR